MKANKIKPFLICGALLISLMLCQGPGLNVYATDINSMLKQINKELRQSQKDMFSGKTEKAIASLEKIKQDLLAAKQADPNNAKIKSYENKYRKLVKDLERRTGKNLGGGTLTAAGASTKTELPSKPEAGPVSKKPAESAASAKSSQKAQESTAASAKLPYHARQPLKNAENDLRSIDNSLKKLNEPDWNKKQLLEDMNKYLKNARKNFEKAKAEAAQKGMTSHPRFDAVQTDITDAEKEIEAAGIAVAREKEKASANAAEVTRDVQVLKDSYDKVLPVFEKATGTVIYYNDLKEPGVLIEKIEVFEKNDLDTIKEQMQAFGQKYGTTGDVIDQKAASMGYADNYYRASFAYVELGKGIENIKKTRTVMASDLIQRAGEMKERNSKGIHDFARLKQHARIKAWGEMAARFDPKNPMVKSFNDELEAWAAADLKSLNAKIDRATFPKETSDAPQNAQKLAAAAKTFLQKEENKLAAQKGKEVSNVLKVVVTGPWRVFKKNILGEPIQYNLPIATAVQTKSEKSQNLARVYLSTMLTHEMKGVKKAPPFLGATVGDSYYIRPSALD